MTIFASASVPASSRLIDSPTVDLAAIRRGDDRYAEGYADGLHRAVAARNDRDLLVQALRAHPDAVQHMAGLIRAGEAGALTGEQVKGELETFARQLGVFPPACPAWCSYDHRGEATAGAEVDGFSIGLVHERVMTELTGIDPATLDEPAAVSVLVESTTEAGDVHTPPRVVLSVAEGTDAAYPGSDGVQGWTGTPEQARALAAALLAAAELVDAR